MSDIDRRRYGAVLIHDENGFHARMTEMETDGNYYHESAVLELVEALRYYQDDHDSYVQHYSAETHQECECEQCQKINKVLTHYKEVIDES